jgi:2-hydroxychromene-2-carboxylate isomerase
MKRLDFYFDYLSPFSFIAWKRLGELKPLAQVDLIPVALGPLLNHWGIKGPGEVQPKREFLLKSCLRRSAREGFAFTTPKTHPFNSLYALRLSIKEVAGDHQEKVVGALWRAGWEQRIDMGEPDELLNVLRAESLPADELYEKSFLPAAKRALKANIQQALAAGVFGVPSFVVEGELFWGEDSLPDLLAFLTNRDPLDHGKLVRLLESTPRAAGQSL